MATFAGIPYGIWAASFNVDIPRQVPQVKTRTPKLNSILMHVFTYVCMYVCNVCMYVCMNECTSNYIYKFKVT